MEVVEDGGGGGVSGQDRGRAGGDVAGPVAHGPGAHEPAAVPLAAHALGHVMVDQVCRGVVPVVAAVLAQEGPLLAGEVELVAKRPASRSLFVLSVRAAVMIVLGVSCRAKDATS
jgi:hypothetical protein